MNSLLFKFIILFIFIVALGALFLICLSLLTPWSRRKRAFFRAIRHPYKRTAPFPSLLRHEDDDDDLDESRAFRCSKPEVYLTVIIPAMNEELRLPLMLNECLEYLSARATANGEFTYEVIVVDDGSTDSTRDIAFNYSQRCPLYVLQLPENRGKGGAVREGVLCARGQFILFADADGATLFSDFEKLEKQMRALCNGENAAPEEPADWTHPALVVGSRAHLEEEAIAKRSLFRTVLMLGFHAIVWLFTVRTIRDTQCGFKLFSRSAAAKLFTQIHIERWAFDVELIYLAERQHFSIAEVAVQWTEIEGSKVTPIFSWLQMGRDILLIWYRYAVGIWTLNSSR